jgi:regulator of replication initiation timing
MTEAELLDAVKRLHARLLSTKRALKVLQGQQRASIQLLASLDDDLHALRGRLEHTADQEAKHAEQDHFSGAELFV